MHRLGTFKPLLLAAVAIAIAGRAQAMFSGQSSSSGWIVFAAAVVLFIAALGRVSVGQFAAAGAQVDTGGVSPQATFFATGLILAAISTIGSVLLFGRESTGLLAWDLHLLSLLLLVAAFVPWGRLTRPTWPTLQQLAQRLAGALPVLLVLALATFARLWQLGTFPFGYWYDEAQNGLAALQILTDPLHRPIYFDSTNAPAHLNFLIALAFSLFGETPASQRLVSALFGILAVLFAYLLFRRWLGNWMGLFAAAVLAVMRYHLTFSRFGVQVISAPAFELATLYFLDRALARKRLSDFAWLGLSLGLGLAFYTAFRLFPVALGAFVILLLLGASLRLGLREAIGRYVVQLWRHWSIALLALLIAVAPVAQFALTQPDRFFARTNTVSIFEKRDQPDLAKALWSNTAKHLEMFNVRGDGNGRHNLPGAPMLDPVMGVLFVLGAAYALWHWKQPGNLLMLLVFAIMLLAGILSLDFEAPQSLRSIGVIPALVYFVTLPVAAMAEAARPLLQRTGPPALLRVGTWMWSLRMPIAAGALVLVIGVVAYLNLHTFFVVQQNDPSAWASYSTAETITANEMRKNQADYDFLITAVYDRGPITSFLAAEVKNEQRWTATDRLPVVRSDPGKGLIILLDGTMVPTYLEAKQIYPSAQFVEWHAPAGGGVVLYEVIVSADELQKLQGVEAAYYPGADASGSPSAQGVLAQAAADWTETQPAPLPFVALLRSTLRVEEYGDYRFSIAGGPGAKLFIDGNPVSDAPVQLARGTHALRLEVPGGTTSMQLLWQPPGAAQMEPIPAGSLFRPAMQVRGLLGSYYPNATWSGSPAFAQIDPAIAFYFHITPLPQPFSVEWSGKLFAPADGAYDLGLESVDGSWLDIDQQIVVENPTGHAKVDGTVNLTRGWHDIRVRFIDQTGGTQIYLWWTPPGATAPAWIPSLYLSPPMAQLPTLP